MNYFQFNIGDYISHTQHLEHLEDLAYRRILDLYYLHEKPIPKDLDELARLISMREHTESIAAVLRDFFTLTDDGYINCRVEAELAAYREKSQKAKAAAKTRWDKNRRKNKGNPAQANEERAHCKRNTKQETKNTKQKTRNTTNKENKPIADSWSDWGWPSKPSENIFNAWLEMRRSNRYPITDTSFRTIGKELKAAYEQGFEIDDCLAQAELNSWKGFQSSWMTNTTSQPLNTSTNSKHNRPSDWAEKRSKQLLEIIDHE